MKIQEITHQINLFREFLIASWPFLDKLMKNHDWDNDVNFTEDWVEANWELLVEREILGKGATITPLSISENQRVFNKGIEPNYSVVTLLPNEMYDLHSKKIITNNISYRLIGFCTSLERGGFGLYPPFDVAILTNDNKKPKDIYKTSCVSLSFFLKNLDSQ